MNAPPPGRSPRRALVYRAVGLLALGLAAIGVVLPVMPTTVFLIVALWAFARGSPEWAERLRRNRRFGPYIRHWEERGAIPTRAKVLAVSMMAVSWAIVAVTTHNGWIAAAVGVVLAGVAAYVVSRPAA
jgi:hypothetical protein